jgi:hypothetical protein
LELVSSLNDAAGSLRCNTSRNTASIGPTEKITSFSAVLFDIWRDDCQATTRQPRNIRSCDQANPDQSALINLIAAQNDLPRRTVVSAFNMLESVMLSSLHPRGVGEFTLTAFLKITLRKVPARKAGTLIRNPATGEMTKGTAKPASVRVKIPRPIEVESRRDILPETFVRIFPSIKCPAQFLLRSLSRVRP